MPMSESDDPVSILPVSECWNLLEQAAVGRLVTAVDGHPEIFPVNFVVQRKTVLFRTAGGTKLASAGINNQVLFEADAHDDTSGWSVVIKGRTRSVRDRDEIAEAQQAGLLSWIATRQPHYVRILPTSITGRRFRFGSAPQS